MMSAQQASTILKGYGIERTTIPPLKKLKAKNAHALAHMRIFGFQSGLRRTAACGAHLITKKECMAKAPEGQRENQGQAEGTLCLNLDSPGKLTEIWALLASKLILAPAPHISRPVATIPDDAHFVPYLCLLHNQKHMPPCSRQNGASCAPRVFHG